LSTITNEYINLLIGKLEIASVLLQLPSSFQPDKNVYFENKEINSLIGYSSILSLSENPDDISQSYEIITRLLEFTNGSTDRVVSAADIIFSRIGNFPGRTLLRSRYLGVKKINISAPLKLECVARDAENTVYFEQEKSVLLTDFQYKFFDSLNEETALSVSAPTSAGKSFVLNLDLIRQIQKKTGQSIVYIVPTRALISEVSFRIRSTLKDAGLTNVIVRTAPFPVDMNKTKQSVVYIFTQERMMSFINSQEGHPYVTSLIIDEAHEIQNGKRGIVLQNAIDITLSRFKNIKLLFASPLIKNPSYFLSLFEQNSSGRFFVETLSPVSQNLILVNQVHGKPLELDISILSKNKSTPVTRVKTEFRFRDTLLLQRANFAYSISNMKDSVISFSNGPSDAEKTACCISKLVKDFKPSEEVLLFIDFIRSEVHPEYPLIECLLNGVAFHYGNMPSLVRSGIERLFKEAEIKIICCTSTLLQGVNLPAKHIIIENPMSGSSKPMSRADFLNLSGRAGRLLHEFHGNIWCIRPESWQHECYKGEKLQEITSAISKVMEDGGLSVQELLNGNNVDNDEAEAAFGKLYHDYLVDPELGFIEKYRTENNSKILDETLESIAEIQITLPIKILENNQSLRPDHLERLYQHLKNDNSLHTAFPILPYIEGAKKRMEVIFETITTCFDWKLSDTYKSWISYLAYQWVWGEPIGKMLTNRVNYKRDKGSTDSVSVTIRGCLKVLENSIRFKLVKYFSAYVEILKYVALEKQIIEKDTNIEPYHIYLEFGSCNRHALNLMALGISRFTALYLEDKFDFPEGVEAEQYLEKMTTMNLDSINMPFICLKELKDIIN
jgi:superfamily II DNA/RNA helicase